MNTKPVLTIAPFRTLGQWLVMALLTLATLVGCGRQESYEGMLDSSDVPELRIVSLSPAITQILKDLGQIDTVVGVGQFDFAAPPTATVVGNYLDINAEELTRLKPTMVLTMSGSEGPPARLVELSQANGFLLVSYPIPKTPTDVGNIIVRETEMISMPVPTEENQGNQPPVPSIGALLDLFPKAAELKHTMLFRLAELSRITKDQGSPSTLMVIGTQPLMASGPGAVHDHLLAMAGGRNAAYEATVSAPTYDREKLLELKPDVVLIFDIQGQPLGPIESDPRLADLRGLDIPAVKNNRIVLISDSHALLPSSTLDRTAGIMAKALHPELSDKIDWILKASRSDLIRKSDIDAVTTAPAVMPTGPDQAPAQNGQP